MRCARWGPPDSRCPPRSGSPAPPAEDAGERERQAYAGKLDAWRDASKLANIRHDGSKARSRFHHGLIAQEVAELIARTGVDFGGFQDRRVKGGDDVLSHGYSEFIAPLIKAVQELAARNDALASRNDDLAAENASILARLARLEGSQTG